MTIYFSSILHNCFQVTVLSTMGGHNVTDTTRRILYKLGSPRVWSNYSLKGRGNKASLSGLKIYRVLHSKFVRSIIIQFGSTYTCTSHHYYTYIRVYVPLSSLSVIDLKYYFLCNLYLMRPINLENVGQFKINQINNILINDPSSDFNNSMLKLNFISE